MSHQTNATLKLVTEHLKEIGYPVYFLNRISKSLFFQKLIDLHFFATVMQSHESSQAILLDVREIEENLFWDEGLEMIRSKVLENKNINESSVLKTSTNSNTHFDSVHHTKYGIPKHVGWRCRLIMWTNIFSRLIDQSLVATVYLDKLRHLTMSDDHKSAGNNENIGHPPSNPIDVDMNYYKLIGFHEAILWSARAVRLLSLFHSYSIMFARQIVEWYIYSTTNVSSNTSECNADKMASNYYVDRIHDPIKKITELSKDHPLSQLRFFSYDKVFVNSDPEYCIGGGMMGILVLGSEHIDISQACKIYGKEILAQEAITKAIIKLRHHYAKKHFDHHWSSEFNEKKHFGCLFSIFKWMSASFSTLTPQLICSVDYKGFRIVVSPLYQRPPTEIKSSSLLFGSTLYNELIDMNNQVNHKIPFMLLDKNIHTEYSVSIEKCLLGSYSLLVLDKTLPFSVTIHKVFNNLIAIKKPMKESIQITNIDLNLEKSPLVFRFSLLDSILKFFDQKSHENNNFQNMEYNKMEKISEILWKTLSNNFSSIPSSHPNFIYENPFFFPNISFSNIYLYFSNEHLNHVDLARLLKAYVHDYLPNCVKSLESQKLNSPFDSASFNSWIKKKGINCRFLGYMINMTSQVWIKQLILVEIVARTLKRFLENCVRAASLSTVKALSCVELATHESHAENIYFLQCKQSLPVSSEIADELLACNMFDNVNRKEVFISMSMIPELLAINIIRLALSSSQLSEKFWNIILAPYVEKQFGCYLSYIKLYNCPSKALIAAYAYHTGVRYHVDLNRCLIEETYFFESLKKMISEMHLLMNNPKLPENKYTTFQRSINLTNLFRENICIWTPIIKTSVNLESLWMTMPGLKYILNPEEIPLLQVTHSDLKCHTVIPTFKNDINEEIKSATLQNEKNTSTDISPSLNNIGLAKLGNNFLCDHTIKPTKPLISPSQKYVSSCLNLLFNVIDNISLMFKREIILETMDEKHSHQSKISLNNSILFKLSNEFQKFETIALKENPNNISVQTKYGTSDIAKVYICLANCFMNEDEWPSSIIILEEALNIVAYNSLHQVHIKFTLLSCYAVQTVDWYNSNHIWKRIHFDKEFDSLLKLCSFYWNFHHPIITDVFICYSWCLYLLKEHYHAQMICIASIKHMYYLLQFELYHLLKTHDENGIQITAMNKLGQLFRLLGNICFTIATNAYYSGVKDLNNKAVDFFWKDVNQNVNNGIISLNIALHLLNSSLLSDKNELILAYLNNELALGTLFSKKIEVKPGDQKINYKILNYFLQSLTVLMKIGENIDFIMLQVLQHLILTLKNMDQYFQAFKVSKYTAHKLISVLIFIQKENRTSSKCQNEYFFIHTPYRPDSLLSLLGYSFHDVHFHGIHDLTLPTHEINKVYSCTSGFSRIKELYHLTLDHWILPDLATLLKSLMDLFINHLLRPYQFNYLLKIFQKYHYTLPSEFDDPESDDFINYYLKKLYLFDVRDKKFDQIHNPEYNHSGGSMISSDLDMIINCIKKYPKIIPIDTLIHWNLDDEHLNKYLYHATSQPNVNEILTSNIFLTYPVFCFAIFNSNQLFDELLIQCDNYLSFFREVRKKNIILNLNASEMSPNPMKLNPDSVFGQVPEFNQKHTFQSSPLQTNFENIKRFNDLHFKSKHWDILCSILFYFFNLEKFASCEMKFEKINISNANVYIDDHVFIDDSFDIKSLSDILKNVN